jgi:hypothetical protein
MATRSSGAHRESGQQNQSERNGADKSNRREIQTKHCGTIENCRIIKIKKDAQCVFSSFHFLRYIYHDTMAINIIRKR